MWFFSIEFPLFYFAFKVQLFAGGDISFLVTHTIYTCKETIKIYIISFIYR